MSNHNKEVYIFTDQPTTCPLCGSRTNITHLDKNGTQEHCCLNQKCLFEFIEKEDS